MTFDAAQQRQPFRPNLFRSFFQGGFECSTHRERDGRRLDVTRSTAHDIKALEDYRMLAELGIRTIRDGLRWHLIDGGRAHPFGWTSFKPMLEAAEEAGVEVLWDLLHFGWPDHIDVFNADFPKRFAEFSAAAVELIKAETGRRPTVTPVNEISFLSWGGGDHALFNPMTKGRGDELKRQLVRASIAAIEAVWSIDRDIRITHTDPAINVVPFPGKKRTERLAQERSEAQFQAWDMISGKLHPELGGKPEYLDIIGVNYYCHNQWLVDGPPLEWEVPQDGYTPPRHLFARIHKRYGRPMYISETGIEAELRPKWFDYICTEVYEAMAAGVPIHGICLYPVMNHPGWVDDRHCPNGLIDYDPKTMRRWPDEPLLAELRRQQERFAPMLTEEQPAAV
jgi:beta-glucosidase/6-phospho-beta-glucosidase/beta-galactosidase